MAIDTAVKRASVAGFIIPDSTLDQGDRQTIAGMYAGILAAGGTGFLQHVTISAVEVIMHSFTVVEIVTHSLATAEVIEHAFTVEDS